MVKEVPHKKCRLLIQEIPICQMKSSGDLFLRFLRLSCRKPHGAANTSCKARDSSRAGAKLTACAGRARASGRPHLQQAPVPAPRARGPMGWAPGGGPRPGGRCEAGGGAAGAGVVVAVAAGAAAAAWRASVGRGGWERRAPALGGGGGGGGGRECRARVRVRDAGWSAAVSGGWRRSLRPRPGPGVTRGGHPRVAVQGPGGPGGGREWRRLRAALGAGGGGSGRCPRDSWSSGRGPTGRGARQERRSGEGKSGRCKDRRTPLSPVRRRRPGRWGEAFGADFTPFPSPP